MLNDNEKRNLRNLFQSPAWSVIQKALEEYKKNHFFEGTAKRGTDFDTMWYIAHNEGGRAHLDGFITHLNELSGSEVVDEG